jgi:hypothetical protein
MMALSDVDRPPHCPICGAPLLTPDCVWCGRREQSRLPREEFWEIRHCRWYEGPPIELDPEAAERLHCDECRLRYGRLVPPGPAMAARDFRIEWCMDYTNGTRECHHVPVPFGTRLTVLLADAQDPLQLYTLHTTSGEVQYSLSPYIVRIEEGLYAGCRSFAYWCEVTRPEGARRP